MRHQSIVNEIADRMPTMEGSWAGDFADPASPICRERMSFDVWLTLWHAPAPLPEMPTVVDVGGGMGIFSAAIGALGGRSILVDDHYEFLGKPVEKQLEAVWDEHKVELVRRDVLTEGMGDIEHVDAITAFHIVEHLHNSPKAFLHDAVDRLKPGGVLIIAVPNGANLRKRITVPLLGTAPTPFEHWYEEPVYRGHVREPVVPDLKAIAADLDLTPKIIGRNFLGRASPSPRLRQAAEQTDRFLRRMPSLCSDLYLIGRKPA